VTHRNLRFQTQGHFERHVAKARGEQPEATTPRVRIYEVAPRDGLQNESTVVPAADKIELVRRLVSAGVRDVEVTSFVKPSWIPQLADAREVIAGLRDLYGREDLRLWALTPNRRGLERAIDSDVRHVATFMSASETHNKKNLNRTRRESLAGLADVIGTAKASGQTVRAYLSTVFGCPYEGDVSLDDTIALSLDLLALGADELALGDTTGMGNPAQVVEVVQGLTAAGVPIEAIALHMHDTRGTALANVLAGYQVGVRTFDGSVAGVGGCPYARGASGNAASDDLVNLFEAMGVHTGIDIQRLAGAGVFLADRLGRELPGRYHRYHVGASTDEDAQIQSA
jgi:hydroxymethylglutaryl-CoA lyase